MNPMLTDEDLTALLGEAAGTFAVPDEGPAFVLEEHGDGPSRSWLGRRGLAVAGVAAAAGLVALLAQSGGLDLAKNSETVSPASARGAAGSAAGSVGGAGDLGGTSGGGTTGGTSGTAYEAMGSGPPVTAPRALSGVKAPLPAAGQVVLPPAVVPQGGQVAPVDGARVVKTGDLSLVVDDGRVTDTVTRVTALAKGAGGYVADSSTQELGDNPTALLSLRVPVAQFETLIGQIRALKVEVASQSASGKDVTAEYADTQAQIQSLQAARQRFLVILGGTKTIGETLAVQQRVDEVQAKIDRLEGQRRVLENQSDKATLTVNVGEKADQALITQERSGLSKAWYDARHGFTSGVESLLAHSGRALLVLIVVLVGLVLARPVWRLARRRLV